MGSAFNSLLAERQVYEIRSMLKGENEDTTAPPPHTHPEVPFLFNCLYFFAPSKRLAPQDWVRGSQHSAQALVSRDSGKNVPVPEGGSASSGRGHSGR